MIKLNQMLNEGKILIICKNCGTILYRYAIGDKNDKNKFNGPPIPKKALSGYDRFTCPVCGEPLNIKPKAIKFHSLPLFNKLYSEKGYKLIENSDTNIIENMQNKSTIPSIDKASIKNSD